MRKIIFVITLLSCIGAQVMSKDTMAKYDPEMALQILHQDMQPALHAWYNKDDHEELVHLYHRAMDVIANAHNTDSITQDKMHRLAQLQIQIESDIAAWEKQFNEETLRISLCLSFVSLCPAIMIGALRLVV